MKAFKPKDGVRVTTPLLAGFGSLAGMDSANACEHEYEQRGDGTPVEDHPELTLYLEQCSKCVATRSRVEGPEEILQQHFPEITS